MDSRRRKTRIIGILRWNFRVNPTSMRDRSRIFRNKKRNVRRKTGKFFDRIIQHKSASWAATVDRENSSILTAAGEPISAKYAEELTAPLPPGRNSGAPPPGGRTQGPARLARRVSFCGRAADGLAPPARIAPAAAAQKQEEDHDQKQGVHGMSFRGGGLEPTAHLGVSKGKPAPPQHSSLARGRDDRRLTARTAAQCATAHHRAGPIFVIQSCPLDPDRRRHFGECRCALSHILSEDGLPMSVQATIGRGGDASRKARGMKIMQFPTRLMALVALGLSAGGCATIIEGTDQPIGVVTAPPGATCTLTREGKVIAQISPTPGQIVVEKTKHDILIECTKDGYQRAQIIAKSTFSGTTFGNVLAGGIIGVVVDASSGANNEYPESVNVQMTPLATPAPQPKPASGTPTS